MNTTPKPRCPTPFRHNLLVGLVAAFLTGCSETPLNGQTVALEKGCNACHGDTGIATAPIYPNLKGQWEQYLRLQLIAYRSGRRDNTIMNGFAQSLTDEEIRALAAFYGI